jgi:transcription antitermination factor NusG
MSTVSRRGFNGGSTASDPDPEWVAVHVRTGREHSIASHLWMRGYEVFLPSYSARHRWSDRVKILDRALFPGYIFCRLDAEVGAKIVAVPGVFRIVGDDRGPVPIATYELDAVRRITGTSLSVEPWSSVVAGQQVLIARGPLRGIEGCIVRTKDRQRLIVEITLLQRAIAVEIESDWIRVSCRAMLSAHEPAPRDPCEHGALKLR